MKPSLSHAELLEQLTNRGLALTHTCNKERALRYLKLDGYYRLSGYFWEFYDNTAFTTGNSHTFETGTTWDDVLHLYHTDKDLRYLLSQVLAEIEISIKAVLTDTVCSRLKKGLHQVDAPDWCWHSSYYQPSFQYSGFTKLRQKLERNRDDKHSGFFLRKFIKANPNQNPYTWMMMQTLTCGEVTTIVNNLDVHLIEGFSEIFTLGMMEMPSVLNSLNKLRNLCAHHERLWNRTIRELPAPNKALCLRPNKQWIIEDKKLASAYFIIRHMLKAMHPSKCIQFKEEFGNWLHQLCNTEERAKRFLPKMGFSPSILTGYFPTKPQPTDSLA